jgi:citrate synthase
MAAALGSLKGPLHGGANIQVCQMMDEIKRCVKDWNDDAEIEAYLTKIFHGEAGDGSGKLYGIGHAVYSLSDPRALIFEKFVKQLSASKGREHEYELYARVARLAPQVVAREKKMYKGISANIDFYSGFVYDMLNLPPEMYTPIFAIARVTGWGAHRIEELVNSSRIIRPAYKSVCPSGEFVPLDRR